MKKRLLYILLTAGLLAAAALTTLTVPASAEQRTITVRLLDGTLLTITVDVPPGTPLSEIEVPGVIVNEPAPPPEQTPTAPAPTPTTPEPAPQSGGGTEQERTSDRRRPTRRRGGEAGGEGTLESQPQLDGDRRTGGARVRRNPLRNPDGSPTPSNPGFFDALPGPSTATGVPNFVIRKFRVPIFLLPIYQAAGIQYGIRWEILAAINEIETDYGRNLNVSSAGAVGWMQFLPSTWRTYGTDANKDGRRDPYNPVDAIFAAARYLDAAGYEDDVRRAIFAYNHADWYVDSVMLRARLIAGVPADLVGSLTGLTEGRFPVAARARYADDLAEEEALRRVRRGENAANVIESADSRRDIDIFAARGAPVVAVNDGVIKKVGRSARLGRYVVLQDVYGNRYSYAHLGSLARYYPVPRDDAADAKTSARALAANGAAPAPSGPASAGRQLDDSDREPRAERRERRGAQASVPIKQRLFAHPDLPAARESGGLEQLLDARARRDGGFETYRNYFSRPFGLDSSDVRLRRLRRGARVIGGTILGRIGRSVPGKAAHLNFAIRPAGRGAPRIDPKPILDGWKLLEATAIYRAKGQNVLYGGDGDAFSIGQILLLPKPLLERRVLSDERIEIYDCGRDDIRSGQVDRRVLATMAYLAESGLRPTITSLKCGHGFYTSSGNVSHHSSGNAVDIAKVNGIPILGHQDPGGITEQTVRQLMRLQGTMRPDQIISLFEIGGPTFAMADHADHIHVGFRPLFGVNGRLGRQAFAVLKPGQWSDLLDRLREIDNPVVPTRPSRFSLPAAGKRASDAHAGE
jgi:hypothetical protein